MILNSNECMHSCNNKRRYAKWTIVFIMSQTKQNNRITMLVYMLKCIEHASMVRLLDKPDKSLLMHHSRILPLIEHTKIAQSQLCKTLIHNIHWGTNIKSNGGLYHDNRLARMPPKKYDIYIPDQYTEQNPPNQPHHHDCQD